VLEGADLQEQLRHFVNDVIEGYVDAETAEGYAEDWDLDQLWTALKALYPVSITVDDVAEPRVAERAHRRVLREELPPTPTTPTTARGGAGREVMREVERRVMLSVLDRKWREHLYEMDYLKEGIGLRAMAQRDPLVEYQREGFNLFEAMMDRSRRSRRLLFNVRGPGRSSVRFEVTHVG
jgi:preprotein translocase subunit SecA